MPGVAVGGGTGPGCFTHTKGIQISTSQLFWWEVRPELLTMRHTLTCEQSLAAVRELLRKPPGNLLC